MIPRLHIAFTSLSHITLMLLVLIFSSSCTPPKGDSVGSNADKPVITQSGEVEVRVRIMANATSVQLQSSGVMNISSQWREASLFRSPVSITVKHDSLEIASAGARPVAVSTAGIWVVPQQGHTVEVAGKNYLGKMRIVPATGPYAQPGKVDVIIHLPMEDYLSGVLQAELYSSWPLETFKAQAIAARSYTYFEMGMKSGRTYDLEGSVASQAYAGAGAHSKAVDAVEQTRGVVLMWQGNVLPAFYSSTCGGTNQYASLVLPHGTTAAPVNSARATCTWCRGSKYYSWGPLRRDRVTLSRRIAAWGRASKEPIAALGTLTRVDVTGTTPAGRPTRFTLTDDAGRAYSIGAESFRFACNFDAPGVAAVPSGLNLRSSHCRVTVSGSSILFDQGHGHGHGVGLCQWGAQGLASAGYNAQSILAFYYPGSELKKLY